MFQTGVLKIFMILIFLSTLPGSFEYRILGIFPLNARSHMMMFEQLMKGLARRGHQVDVISTFPQKIPYPNYTDIVIPSSLPKLVNNISYDRFHDMFRDDLVHFCATQGGNDLCEAGLENPRIKKLIDEPPTNPPYDAVVTEVLCANCFIAFGHHLKVPVIGLSSCVLYPWTLDVVADPVNLAFVPNNLLEYKENMNLWNRLYNVVHTLYNQLYFNYLTLPQNQLIKKYFGPNVPDIRELEKSLAIVLVNSHLSLNGVKPTTPAHIEVGGLHIQDDNSEISKKHQRWLDDSNDGFIYFTFGSMVNIESFPENVIKNMYKSFNKIAPTRVFMKVAQPELLPPNLPKNIRIFDWVPQINVLKHKNIRAFITHGGLMGTQEAIYHGVPMIGIPLFGDQFLNIDRYVKRNIAMLLNYRDLTEEKLDHALNNILENPIYRKMAKKVAERFSDRPRTPMDEACFWIEYVIRHGSEALRSPALDFSWWQLALIDVYAILFITCIAALLILMKFALIFIRSFDDNSLNVKHLKKSN